MGNNMPPTSVVWEILNLSHANGIYIYITILVCVCVYTHKTGSRLLPTQQSHLPTLSPPFSL